LVGEAVSARRFQFAIAAFALLLCLVPFSSQAQGSKRLILKDGSFQMASKWEVKGNRVRYYSTERSDWEEVPNSLVDWPATEAWEKERNTPPPATDTELKKLSDEAKAAREETNGVEIAPGVTLPVLGGVFMVDIYRDQPQAVEIIQNGSEVNKNTRKNIIRAAINPIATAKQSFEVKGAHARVQSHVQQPVFYIDIDNDTQGQPLPISDHFRIVKMEQKKDSRVVSNLKIAFYGKVSQAQSFVPAKAEKGPGDWIKVTPAEPLGPGEYALVEMLNPKEMNLYVWDLGVNPTAPQNPGTWSPDPIKENKTGTEASPVLTPGKKK
jgi:hypothetical protein